MKILNLIVSPLSVKGATAVLAVTLFVSNILGVIRDHYLAQKIPADVLDTYFAAFRLPDLIFNVLILGAVSAAFVPVFTDLIAKRQRALAHRVANTLLVIAVVTTTVLVLIFYVAMPQLMSYLVPDFPLQKLTLTVSNARLLLWSPIIFGLSFIVSGMLTATKRFIATALSPIVYNGSIIAGTVLLADRFSVSAVVWAVIVGALLHLVVQLPSLAAIGFRLRPVLDWRNRAVVTIGKLMLPRTVGLGANQLLLLAFTFIASKIGGGAIAIYNFADNIQTTPVVIFATSIAQALFPTLAEHHSLKRVEDFSRHIERAIGTIIFILTPMAAGLVLLRAQIVRLILGSGYFGWEETIVAARTLGWFGLGLVFGGLLPLLHRAFFARYNTMFPAIGSILAVIIAIGVAALLVPAQGVAALPIGYSVGLIVEVVMLYLVLRRSVVLNERALIVNTTKVLLATFVMAVAVQTGKILVGSLVPLTRFVEVLAQLLVATAFGVIVYFPVINLLKHPGLQFDLKRFVVAKLNGAKNGKI